MRLPDFPHYKDTQSLIAAEMPDFPSFLFSERELRKSADVFHKGFPGIVTYAVKANPSEHIISILADSGVKAFDVASPNEMEIVRRLAPDAAMHYNNPIKSRREIAIAWETYGIRSYTIDNLDQLEQIAAIIPPSKDVEITLRFKALKALKSYDFGTKFGATEGEAILLASAVKQRGYGTSLCFHVGSQCEDAPAYERHIAAAGRIAHQSGIELKRLNVGGGFPADYPSSEAPPIQTYFDTISESLKEAFGDSPPQLIVEPGRAMVTSSTSLLLRVKHKRAGISLYLNDGAYGALMEVKFMPIIPRVRAWHGSEILEGHTSGFALFGPTCDSYDVLPQTFDLPQNIEEDDYIEFAQMGAYSQASTTSFNGFSERLQFYVDNILM